MNQASALTQMLALATSRPKLVPLNKISSGFFVHDVRVFYVCHAGATTCIFPVLANGKISSRPASIRFLPSAMVEETTMEKLEIAKFEWEE